TGRGVLDENEIVDPSAERFGCRFARREKPRFEDGLVDKSRRIALHLRLEAGLHAKNRLGCQAITAVIEVSQPSRQRPERTRLAARERLSFRHSSQPPRSP